MCSLGHSMDMRGPIMRPIVVMLAFFFFFAFVGVTCMHRRERTSGWQPDGLTATSRAAGFSETINRTILALCRLPWHMQDRLHRRVIVDAK